MISKREDITTQRMICSVPESCTHSSVLLASANKGNRPVRITGRTISDVFSSLNKSFVYSEFSEYKTKKPISKLKQALKSTQGRDKN